MTTITNLFCTGNQCHCLFIWSKIHGASFQSKNNEDEILHKDLLCFAKNVMTLRKVLEMQSISVNDTLCNVSYISKHEASGSAFDGNGGRIHNFS